jgi:hypothetical protein
MGLSGQMLFADGPDIMAKPKKSLVRSLCLPSKTWCASRLGPRIQGNSFDRD